MYRKILVPVDGSPTSVCGLDEAVRLAKHLRATLCLLRVVDANFIETAYLPMAPDYEGFMSAMGDGGRHELEKMAGETHSRGSQPKSSCSATLGRRTGDMIVAAAATWGADVIVMGTQGGHDPRRPIFGIDTAFVISSSPVPVLVVRNASENTP